MNSEPGASFLTCETMLSVGSLQERRQDKHIPVSINHTASLAHWDTFRCGCVACRRLSVWEIWELNSDPL